MRRVVDVGADEIEKETNTTATRIESSIKEIVHSVRLTEETNDLAANEMRIDTQFLSYCVQCTHSINSNTEENNRRRK